MKTGVLLGLFGSVVKPKTVERIPVVLIINFPQVKMKYKIN